MDITPEAKEKMKEFLQDNDESFVRVANVPIGSGCAAKFALGVTLDEDKDEDNDLTFTFDGLSVVIDKDLHESLGDLLIGFDPDKGITVSVKT